MKFGRLAVKAAALARAFSMSGSGGGGSVFTSNVSTPSPGAEGDCGGGASALAARSLWMRAASSLVLRRRTGGPGSSLSTGTCSLGGGSE